MQQDKPLSALLWKIHTNYDGFIILAFAVFISERRESSKKDQRPHSPSTSDKEETLLAEIRDILKTGIKKERIYKEWSG